MAQNSAGSKADTAVKLVMVFFISLLSFSVGTYVGKQVSDSDYRRAALEADFHGGEATSVADAAPEADADMMSDAATQPITDAEVASLSEEFIQKEARKLASAADDTTAEAPAATTAPATTHDGYTHVSKIKAEARDAATHEPVTKPTAKATDKHAAKAAPAATAPAKAAERIANDMAPTADPKKVREPSSVLPTVATTAIGKYTVQVASFATENEAKDAASRLTGKGYSAFYVPAAINGKTWFRVSVGLFSDQKTATNYRTELLATKAVDSAIVQKIVK